MTDLAAWLLEQIAEDEEWAREQDDRMPMAHQTGPMSDEFSPDRVLAECDAKRRIVDLHTPEDGYLDCPTCTDRDYRARRYDDDKQLWWCDTLKLLAQPYADRVGYPLDWRIPPPVR